MMARVVSRPKCILLVENELPLQGVLRDAIISKPDLRLAAVCAARSAALEVIDTAPLDIVLVSLHLEDGSGLDVVRAVRQCQPLCEVFVMGRANDREDMFSSMQAGASGYLLKEDAVRPERLCGSSIVNRVAFSGILSSLQVVNEALKCRNGRISELSSVQGDILRCVARGLSNKEIARDLFMSSYNVDYHLRGLRKRFLARNRAQLVRAAIKYLQN
jgi:DNA-binding NarL/FixJ family response regulator